MSKDDQIQALKRRLKAEREDHAKAVAAKNAENRALREAWELFDTYPALQEFLGWLHKVRDAAGPLRSPTYQTGHSANTLTQAERGAFPDRERHHVSAVNRDLEHWTGRLKARMSPRGKLVDDELENTDPRPRCHNPDCPARLIPQAFDQEICFDCKSGFTEFRPVPVEGKRCWTRDCPFYSKTGQCLHAWQRKA